MSHFDVITGIDWLAKYQAILNFFEKKFIVQTLKGVKIQFCSKKLVDLYSSFLKYYMGGRQNQTSVVLLNPIEANIDNEKSIARILVVNECWDVFQEELFELPLT